MFDIFLVISGILLLVWLVALLASRSPAPAASITPDAPGAGPAPSALAGMRILVLEADRAARSALCDLAGQLGVRADSVATNEEAMARLAACDAEGGRYAAALVAVNGASPAQLEDARRLRMASPVHRGLPLVALTDGHGRGDTAALREADLQAHLVRPVALVPLARELARCAREAELTARIESVEAVEQYCARREEMLAALAGVADPVASLHPAAEATDTGQPAAPLAAVDTSAGGGANRPRPFSQPAQPVPHRHLAELKRAWPGS